MSEAEEIVRIAARGDGVTASGRHIPGTAPGDLVMADGTIRHGPHHVRPPCRHFGLCGGCELQHLDDVALADVVKDRVLSAAHAQGMNPAAVSPVHLSPSGTRRRATLHAVNGGGRALVGFHAAGSHKVVDLKQCHVLHPDLFATVDKLRGYLSKREGRFCADIDLARIDQGVDCTIRNLSIEGVEQTEGLLRFCRDNTLARLSLDQGYGTETFWEPEPVTVTLGSVPVPYPQGAFLQATRDAEGVLTAAVRQWLGDCRVVVDLFSGLGTFSFALAPKVQVLAAEASRDAVLASRTAAARHRMPVEAVHRDLFRNPFLPAELTRFDGVVIDPPRAGARAQVEQLAASSVPKIAYVSCNPSSWSRDGSLLAAAGYRLAEVLPVGQFRWSTHVELASLFVK